MDKLSTYSLLQKNSDPQTGVPLDSLLGIEFLGESNSTICSIPSVHSNTVMASLNIRGGAQREIESSDDHLEYEGPVHSAKIRLLHRLLIPNGQK